MTDSERKIYLEYVFNNDLTVEETDAYLEYLEQSETEYGCDASSIPIEILRSASSDEINLLLDQKQAERRQRSAARFEK